VIDYPLFVFVYGWIEYSIYIYGASGLATISLV
jgi:hypothetical protein